MIPLVSIYSDRGGIIFVACRVIQCPIYCTTTQRNFMHHWNTKGPCCFPLSSKQPYIIAVGTYKTAVSIWQFHVEAIAGSLKRKLKSEFYLQKETHWSNPHIFSIKPWPIHCTAILNAILLCLLFIFQYFNILNFKIKAINSFDCYLFLFSYVALKKTEPGL